MQSNQTPFQKHMVRTRIGALEASLPDGDPLKAKIGQILAAYDASEDEHAAAFELRQIVGPAKGRGGQTAAAAYALEDALAAAAD